MALTPEQFNKIATKEDLKSLEDKIDNKIDKKIDRVLTAVDGIAKKFDNHESEHVANLGAHHRFQNELDNHNTRINKLEVKPI